MFSIASRFIAPVALVHGNDQLKQKVENIDKTARDLHARLLRTKVRLEADRKEKAHELLRQLDSIAQEEVKSLSVHTEKKSSLGFEVPVIDMNEDQP
jgi:DNA anti-recombination protein RmuC